MTCENGYIHAVVTPIMLLMSKKCCCD